MKLKYGPYSPSRLDTGICGFAFHKQYVEPDPNHLKVATLPQDRGSAVHEVFEQITARMIKDREANFRPDEVRRWVEDAVNRNPASYEEVGTVLDMAHLYIQKPPPMLTSDAGIELRLAVKYDGNNFVECEYDDPDAFARGRADIMLVSDDTTRAVVYDHKTQPNIEDADTFQMGFYAWVISKYYPFLNEIQTILHFARYGVYSEPYTWTKADLDKVEDEILTRVGVLEKRTSWDPVPHHKCQYCPFMAQCPVWKDYVNIDEQGRVTSVRPDNFKILGSTQKAVQLAGLLNVLEEIVGTCKKELRNHVNNYGAIAIPGKIYEYRAKEGINWDKVNKTMREDVYKVFEKYGVDPRKFMSFNQTASQSVWLEGNEPLVKELSEVLPRKATTEFRGYKS